MAKYEVAVDMPNLPAGHPVEVPPLGLIENGKSKEFELEKEEADRLREAYGVTVKLERTKGGDK